MMMIIFAVTLLLALLLGGWAVTNAKKKLAKERERRLKIAEGKWDELEKETKKPSKIAAALKKPFAALKKISWRSKAVPSQPGNWPLSGHTAGGIARYPAPGTPESAEAQAKQLIPPAVEELLQSWHDYTEGVAAVDMAESAFVAACDLLMKSEGELPGRLHRNGFDGWIQDYLKAYKAWRDANCNYALTHDKLSPQRSRWMSAKRSLKSALEEVESYCKQHLIERELLSQAHADILDIASTVTTECDNVTDPPRTHRPREGWSDAGEQCQSANRSADALLAATKRLLGTCHNLQTAHADVVTNQKAVAELLSSVSHTEPVKPTDQEVQDFMGSALMWSENVQHYLLGISSALPVMAEAMSACESERASVLKIAGEIVSEIIAFVKERTDPESTVEMLASAKARFLKWDAWLAHDLPENENYARAAIAHQVEVVLSHIELLDERTRANLQLARFVTISAESLLKTVRKTAEEATEPGTKVISTGAISEQERNKNSALRNAMRKLGFAIAQAYAAAAKVHQAETQPAPLHEVQEPGLDEASADKYVRAHRRWCEDISYNRGIVETRASKLATFKEHIAERLKHVPEAAQAIGKLLENPSFALHGDSISAELDVTIRAATMLHQWYYVRRRKALLQAYGRATHIRSRGNLTEHSHHVSETGVVAYQGDSISVL